MHAPSGPSARRWRACAAEGSGSPAEIALAHKGQGDIGGTMLPQPEGIWSVPPELLRTLPGYDPDFKLLHSRRPTIKLRCAIVIWRISSLEVALASSTVDWLGEE